jgi:hypothetical protein
VDAGFIVTRGKMGFPYYGRGRRLVNIAIPKRPKDNSLAYYLGILLVAGLISNLLGYLFPTNAYIIEEKIGG